MLRWLAVKLLECALYNFFFARGDSGCGRSSSGGIHCGGGGGGVMVCIHTIMTVVSL